MSTSVVAVEFRWKTCLRVLEAQNSYSQGLLKWIAFTSTSFVLPFNASSNRSHGISTYIGAEKVPVRIGKHVPGDTSSRIFPFSTHELIAPAAHLQSPSVNLRVKYLTGNPVVFSTDFQSLVCIHFARNGNIVIFCRILQSTRCSLPAIKFIVCWRFVLPEGCTEGRKIPLEWNPDLASVPWETWEQRLFPFQFSRWHRFWPWIKPGWDWTVKRPDSALPSFLIASRGDRWHG